MSVIGPAEDFWRLRLIKVDAEDEPDLEWRDDVLYREQRSAAPRAASVWRVEAVRLDDDAVWLLGASADEAEARSLFEEAEDDLRDLTARGFQERYSCG